MVRGKFILFEGLDRVGKTTQSKMLVEHLSKTSKTVYAKLPERSTQIGQLIDSYLKNENDTSPQVAQLLFCANRWEVMPAYIAQLDQGVNIVMDRYIYSAIAYGVANNLDPKWISDMEYGLPIPDIVLYITVPSGVIKDRTLGQSSERYENLKMQTAVKQKFENMYIPNRVTIDGSYTPDVVHRAILSALGEN